MKNVSKTIFLLFLLLCVSFPDVVASLEPADLPKRLIVKFKPETSEEIEQATLRKLELLKDEKLHLKHAYVLVAEAQKVGEMLKTLAATKRIEYIEPDYIAEALEVPNDPYFNKEWGVSKIAAPGAWNITHGINVKVAIVDTGIGNHPDLQSKILARANFTTDSDSDGNGHGTHVAGIAGAVTNNSLGIAGVGYESQLLSIKVLNNNGQGYYSWIANGIIWAADNGADIINLSLGGSSDSKTISDAVAYAWGKGIIIVAAAGNSSSTAHIYPAYYDKVIAVAATDSSDKKAWFSSYGSWVDVAAPGVSIVSTYRGDYAQESGTSMAAPFVSGVAALVKSNHPSWSNSDIREKIEQSSDKIPQTGYYWMWGRVNACRAVDCVSANSLPSPSPTPSPQPTVSPSSSPAPVSSPSPTPSSIAPTVYITSFAVQKQWNDIDKGKIYIDMTTWVARGTWTSPIIKIVPDQTGIWSGLTNNLVTITIGNKSYQTYTKWNEIEKSLTIDLSELGLSLPVGSRAGFGEIGLASDTRGFHIVKLQVLDGATVLRERLVSFSL